MLTARLHARPARLVAALVLVPVLLVGGAGGVSALPEVPGSSPEPGPSPGGPEPAPTPSATELDDEPAADTSPADPLIRLVWVAIAAGLLLGVAGSVGLYLTRKSRGAH